MVDAALIQQCADPALKPAIVETFIERAGSQDPLTVAVRSGNRVVLVPRPSTPDEAMELVRQHVGRNIVRVGITQYPAGVDVAEAGELKPDLVDACANLRIGTALFAKVHRIVTKWYGNPTDKEVLPQVFDDAIIAWQTGYFDGTAVFQAPDPAEVKLTEPTPEGEGETAEQRGDHTAAGDSDSGRETANTDPKKAGIRIDLSGIAREK
ncbi:TraH family protein [Mesorhizobium sp.]|uniref:TraH family protein n=1 Tax=Mesorhizobium sp. TaxID=1871066 RepID=UPI000FE32C0F|nr:TraH family protein [Mesorhizobium sp.]RWB78239.1 MAG: conjugal transfer protein TraH [Mesorhizobium sp.]RWE92639.1 MAG: conjugal transfer protein TraH [Mesorhizobium sp.]RWF88347.1 MAG: conjugal transfer protein TraH [Mesorhizobium sp.]RWF88840.1 MAG: conjugal transfer protein TraH [Mesorhizobium sp.]RWI62346.1 MAG: conjugal transfer protein TraH [Mesorhizobium sp.]